MYNNNDDVIKNMKKIFIILFFSIIPLSDLYAEWTFIARGTNGRGQNVAFYVDFTRIRKSNGFVYFWSLINLIKEKPVSGFSMKNYIQGDCKVFREKQLTIVFHELPMGKDTGITNHIEKPKWTYPMPNSVGESQLQKVCNH